MVKWKEKACLNLLKLSQERHDYLISAKEWEFNCIFHTKPASDSTGIRPPIPFHSGH